MAAPTPSSRSTPAGLILKDGYQSFITFASAPNISFWERKIKPPGLDGGDKIDITTMFNSDWRTFFPRSLVTLTPASVTALYDPNLYNTILNTLNILDTVTVRWSDGSTLAFFGWLRKFEPGELSEGAPPECTIEVEPSNMDSSGVERAPVMTSVSGT
jgi:hypothetical protein